MQNQLVEIASMKDIAVQYELIKKNSGCCTYWQNIAAEVNVQVKVVIRGN